MPDRETIALGDLEAVYRERFGAFVRGVMALGGDADAARDAVQEGFARAVVALGRYRREAPLEAWVWRIVINVAREARRSELRLDRAVDAVAAALAGVEPDELTSGLRAELRALPERQRLAVFFHYFADLSYEEVGRLMEISPGTVAASLNAARETLRQRYREAYQCQPT